MLRAIYKIFSLLDVNLKLKLSILFISIFLSNIFEAFTLLMILPLISILQNPLEAAEILSNLPGNNIYEIPNVNYFLSILTAVLIIASSIRLLAAKLLPITAAQLGNQLLSTVFTSRIEDRTTIHDPNLRASFFALLHKIDIIGNTFFILSTSISSILFLVLILISLSLVSYKISILMVGSVLFLYGLIYLFSIKKLNLSSKNINTYTDSRSKSILDSMVSLREIHLYSKQKFFVNDLTDVDKRYRFARANIIFLGQIPRVFIEPLVMLSVVIVTYFFLTTNSDFEYYLPLLGFFAISFLRMIPHFQVLYQGFSELKGAQSIVMSFDLKDFKRPKEINLKKLKFNKAIRFQNITFSYNQPGSSVIKDISLEIQRGEKIAIIGESGSGKSTLIDLLMGFQSPQTGSIYLDDKKLNKSEILSLKLLYSLVPQSIGILNKSIRENITLGDPLEIELDDILSRSGLKDEIDSKMGMIGEGGSLLSGGQAQRIAIARALYFNREITVFDEGTSSLDKDLEKKILYDLVALKDLTFIHITHRLIKDFYDKIYEFKKGKLIRLK